MLDTRTTVAVLLATTTPRNDGSYEFPAVAVTDDVRVEVQPGPTECQVVGLGLAGAGLVVAAQRRPS